VCPHPLLHFFAGRLHPPSSLPPPLPLTTPRSLPPPLHTPTHAPLPLPPTLAGANDVANSFATSVGSKTLKLWQAVVIAAIFEFLGAMVLGGETTKTVASGIANTSLYTEFPEIYMYGMLCALAVAGTWLLVATMWCFAVSTTHSILGAIMGFALVFGGINGVTWFKEQGECRACALVRLHAMVRSHHRCLAWVQRTVRPHLYPGAHTRIEY
jgi:hypothetical protein